MVAYSEEMRTMLQSDDKVPSGRRYLQCHHHNDNDNPTTLGHGKITMIISYTLALILYRPMCIKEIIVGGLLNDYLPYMTPMDCSKLVLSSVFEV